MTDQIARLAARIATVERRLDSASRTAKLAYSSIEGGAIEVFDEDGSLRAVIGQQPDGTTGLSVVNSEPPLAPSAPTVEPILGGLSVGWDGTWAADPALAVRDLGRIQVHILPSAETEPDVRNPTCTIESQSGGTVAVPCFSYDPVWIKLMAVNTAGMPGPPSDAVQGIARKLVDSDVLSGTLTAKEIKAGSLTADAFDVNSVRAGILTAGSIKSAMIDVDALKGKVITGSVVQTSESGQRIALDPQNSALTFYSGVPEEKGPGVMVAEITDHGSWLQPALFLRAPSIGGDRPEVALTSAQEGKGNAQISLQPTGNLDAHCYMRLLGGTDASDTAKVEMYASRGAGAGGGFTYLEMTGGQIQMKAAGSGISAVTVETSAITLTGAVKVQGKLLSGTGSDLLSGDEYWQTLALKSGFSHSGGNARWRVISILGMRFLQMAGVVQVDTSGGLLVDTVFASIAAEKPKDVVPFAVARNNNAGGVSSTRVDFNTAGNFTVYTSATYKVSWFSLAGVLVPLD
ncbi:hypothetical protein [Streptomyces sp. x-80]|uniref:hypothetical protein n=1 Tax=Streptomyces sp. x-80 TaxID=2789282 RepID=UPI00397ECB94